MIYLLKFSSVNFNRRNDYFWKKIKDDLIVLQVFYLYKQYYSSNCSAKDVLI